ncbi:MAG: 2-dehydro-3-deoxy-phosphogluconate aldolase [Mycoplasmatales bacterium]
MQLKPNFYNDIFSLNCLAKDENNARDIFDICDGNVLIGVLSKNYDSVKEAVEAMKSYSNKIENAVSVGLGAGDPNQCYMVNEILRDFKPQHVNQVFSAVNGARSNVQNNDTFINSLVSPSGKVGFVKISTGPLTSKAPEETIVDINTAISFIKEMGGSSIKFFPMKGLETVEEYKSVCKACAENDLSIEPTGGITKDNFEEICQIAFDAGVKHIIPHVYSSIIDEDGNTNLEDVKELYAIIKKIAQ